MKEVKQDDGPSKAALKLRIKSHYLREHSETSFMISNTYGYVCGGNLMVYIPTSLMKKYDYPTVFRSRDEAESILSSSPAFQAGADYAVKENVRLV
jgi:hypothetical protein